MTFIETITRLIAGVLTFVFGTKLSAEPSANQFGILLTDANIGRQNTLKKLQRVRSLAYAPYV